MLLQLVACAFFRMQTSFLAASCGNLAALSCSNLAAHSCSSLVAHCLRFFVCRECVGLVVDCFNGWGMEFK